LFEYRPAYTLYSTKVEDDQNKIDIGLQFALSFCVCVELSVRRDKIIIIIIAPLTIVKEDQWGYLECLHKACQAAIFDGGSFTDTGVDERCENERQGENDCEMKTVSRVKSQRTDKS